MGLRSINKPALSLALELGPPNHHNPQTPNLRLGGPRLGRARPPLRGANALRDDLAESFDDRGEHIGEAGNARIFREEESPESSPSFRVGFGGAGYVNTQA